MKKMITIETATGNTPIDNVSIFETTISVDNITGITKSLYDDKFYVIIDLLDGSYHRLAYPERDYSELLNVIETKRIGK